jgi:hypothetical protein
VLVSQALCHLSHVSCSLFYFIIFALGYVSDSVLNFCLESSWFTVFLPIPSCKAGTMGMPPLQVYLLRGVLTMFCLGWTWIVILPDFCLLCNWDYRWVTMPSLSDYSFGSTGFELRAPCLLSRLSITWATLPILFCVAVFLR